MIGLLSNGLWMIWGATLAVSLLLGGMVGFQKRTVPMMSILGMILAMVIGEIGRIRAVGAVSIPASEVGLIFGLITLGLQIAGVSLGWGLTYRSQKKSRERSKRSLDRISLALRSRGEKNA